MSQSNVLRYSEPAGLFRADQIRDGDPYELSNGHAIRCMAGDGSHARTSLLGGSMLDSDPAVEGAGVDVGLSPEPRTLRAPDVAVGIPDKPGWVDKVPPLVVEVADVGQDEAELRQKLDEYFAYGAQYVWVVRKVGPQRVEVHEPGEKPRTYLIGDELVAPGALQNPVPVRAWFERDVAHEVTLRNLLHRKGYASLEEVRAAGQMDGLRRAVLDLCEVLGIEVTPARLVHVEGLDRGGLDSLRQHLKTRRAWP